MCDDLVIWSHNTNYCGCVHWRSLQVPEKKLIPQELWSLGGGAFKEGHVLSPCPSDGTESAIMCKVGMYTVPLVVSQGIWSDSMLSSLLRIYSTLALALAFALLPYKLTMRTKPSELTPLPGSRTWGGKEIVTRLDSFARMNLARILCKSIVIRMDSQVA